MGRVLMRCQGFEVGGVSLPKFQLESSKVLVLHAPAYFDYQPLADLLTGQKYHPNLQLLGRASFASTGSLRSARGGVLNTLSARFFSPLVMNWLVQQRLSKQLAAEVMSSLVIDPSWRINQLAGNPRLRLKLQVAFFEKNDVVVFSTAGCDPRGVTQAYDDVRTFLSSGAAIEICHPLINPDEVKVGFPGASHLELLDDEVAENVKKREAS